MCSYFLEPFTKNKSSSSFYVALSAQDCLSLKPASVFLALSVLHQYVVRVGGQSLERKEARDLQDINAKLMEAVAAIAGSRLEVKWPPLASYPPFL